MTTEQVADGKTRFESFLQKSAIEELRANAKDEAHAEALYQRGDSHYRGIDVSQDFGEAAKFYLQAALVGHSEAQLKLGQCYDSSSTVRKPPVTVLCKFAGVFARRAVAISKCSAKF
jgi:TPR repeat protein